MSLMKYTRAFLFAFLLFALGCQEESTTTTQDQSETPSEPTYNLQYNLEADDAWMVKDQRIETTTIDPGTPEEMTITMKTVISRKYNSTGIDKENALNLSMNYNHVYAKYSGPDGEWEYDSAVPSTHREAGGLEFLAGESLEMRMDRNSGQVFGMRGGNRLLEKMTGDSVAAQIGDQLMLEQAMPEFYIFPDGAVEVGANWERSGSFSSRYNVNYTNTFTLESRDGQTAVVKLNAAVSPIEAAQAIPGAGPDGAGIRHELTGTSTGTITVDEVSGKTNMRSSTTNMEGHRLTLGPDGNEISRSPIKIHIQRDSEISYK